jgi:hypothetical protein
VADLANFILSRKRGLIMFKKKKTGEKNLEKENDEKVMNGHLSDLNNNSDYDSPLYFDSGDGMVVPLTDAKGTILIFTAENRRMFNGTPAKVDYRSSPGGTTTVLH